jgi:MinD-like ATPase involved in chromosome partitioning or flagellar assembly
MATEGGLTLGLILDGIAQLVETSKIKAEVSLSQHKIIGAVSLAQDNGTTTIVTELADYYASLGNKVLVIDLNIFSPKLPYYYRTKVDRESSLINLIVSKKDPKSYFTRIPGREGAYFMSPTIIDPIPTSISGTLEDYEYLFNNMATKFDYTFVIIPFDPVFEWFKVAINAIDKGFMVINENPYNFHMIHRVIQFVHETYALGNKINNVLLNKRSKYDFDYSLIKVSHCNYVGEIPFIEQIQQLNIEGKRFNQHGNKDKKYIQGMFDLISFVNNI